MKHISFRKNGRWDAIDREMFPLLIKQIERGRVDAVKKFDLNEAELKEIKEIRGITFIPGKVLAGTNFIDIIGVQKL